MIQMLPNGPPSGKPAGEGGGALAISYTSAEINSGMYVEDYDIETD